MKADDGDAVAMANGCVCLAPVGAGSDSGVHLVFDLAGHELSELRLSGVVSSPDVHSIEHREWVASGLVTV